MKGPVASSIVIFYNVYPDFILLTIIITIQYDLMFLTSKIQK